jgi:RNA polymerase sigma-70 factor (ECF subfamily)
MRPSPPDDQADVLGRLYDAHAPTLYRYALMLLAYPPAAEDVVQDAFAGLLGGAVLPDDPLRYLRISIRTGCYTQLRRRRRWDMRELPLLEAATREAVNPGERVALERALRALPPEQREVVHLHVYEGCTFREIAEMSGESINTMASRYRYALARMREVLTP